MQFVGNFGEGEVFKTTLGMETAAISAVISTTLTVVANKLAPLLIKEYSYVVGVKRDLEELRDQVEEINSWLETRYEAMWLDT